MVIASDYPFLDIFGTMILFFIWVAWIWTVVLVLTDVFRRQDTSGWGKAAWSILIIVVPFLGVFVYLIAQGSHMAERNVAQAQAQRAAMDQYVKETAGTGGAASEIASAQELLSSGAITQAEFDQLKAKAIAGS